MPMCYGNGAYVKVTCFFLAQFMNTPAASSCREIEFRWSEFNFTLSGYVGMPNGERLSPLRGAVAVKLNSGGRNSISHYPGYVGMPNGERLPPLRGAVAVKLNSGGRNSISHYHGYVDDMPNDERLPPPQGRVIGRCLLCGGSCATAYRSRLHQTVSFCP